MEKLTDQPCATEELEASLWVWEEEQLVVMLSRGIVCPQLCDLYRQEL